MNHVSLNCALPIHLIVILLFVLSLFIITVAQSFKVVSLAKWKTRRKKVSHHLDVCTCDYTHWVCCYRSQEEAGSVPEDFKGARHNINSAAAQHSGS